MSNWQMWHDPTHRTLQQRLSAYLATVQSTTIAEAARALQAPYETTKSALHRMVRRGLATSWRDEHDGRVVLYQRIEQEEPEPTTQLPDDGWRPKAWVHPIRARALGRVA